MSHNQKENQRKWYLKNRERILKERKLNYNSVKDYVEINRKRIIERTKKWRHSRKEKLWKKGHVCIICNDSTRRVHYHEIHGKPHSYTYGYILNHFEDFVPLCIRCHNLLHWLFKHKDKKQIILNLLEMIN